MFDSVRGALSAPAGFLAARPRLARLLIATRRPSVRLGLTLLAITGIWTAAWLQWWLNDLVVPWDSKNQFYAFFRFLASALHEGGTPFWNPYHYAGHPSVADPQSLIFTPFFVWAWFDPTPSLFAFDFIVFAHLLVGGLALGLYGHRHGWPAAASVLAASIFMLGGVVAGRMNHVGIITSFGLFPLAFLLLEVALDRRSILAALGFAATAALIALGRTQTPMLLCAIIAVLAVRHLVAQPQPWRYALSRLPILMVMAVAGAALLAVPLLLTAQFAAFSNRPAIDLETALISSWYPVNLTTMFAPNVFGSIQPSALGDWGPSHGTRPGIDGTDRAFNYLFMGSLTALLLIWHGLAGGRLFAHGRRVMTAVAAFAFVYALGRYTPVFPWLFEHVPGISQFRRPVGGLFIVVLAVSYLAGHLVSDYIRKGLPTIRWPVLAVAAIAVAGLCAWAVTFSAQSGKTTEALLAIARMLPVYGALILLLVLPKRKSARVVAATLAALFTGGEMVALNAGSSLNAEPRAWYAFLETPTGRDGSIIATLTREMKRHGGVRPRVEIVGLGGPWQNAAMVYGLEATNGYNPLRIGSYDRLVAPGESPYTTLHREFPASFPSYSCDLSRALGLEFIVLDRPIEQMPHLRQRQTVQTIMNGPQVWIYRLPQAAPRVVLSTRVRVADADAFVDAGRYPAGGGAGQEVMVDDDDDLSQSYAAQQQPPAATPGALHTTSTAAAKPQPAMTAAARALYGAGRNPGRAEIVAWRPDRVEIAVESRTTAVLTLHEPWYPGWEVEVDGKRHPLLRTDVLFRGVEVPAGSHKVVFTYRPLSLENLRAALDGVLGRDGGE